MAITDKYEFETVNYGTSGWSALLATSLERADNFVHTYLRHIVASGESILSHDPVCLINDQWYKAQADGTKQPALGIAIEAGTSGEYLRAQTCGSISGESWTFSGTGEIYLSSTGTLTQTKPSSSAQMLGYPLTPTKMLIVPCPTIKSLGGPLKATSYTDPTTENYVAQWTGISGELKLGPAIGTAANNLVQLDASAKLPAVDGSQLTGIVTGGDVAGPATTTENKVPQWDAAQKTLKDGLTVGTGASNLVQLDASAKLPAVDGSQLTGIATSSTVYTKTDDYTILSGELGNEFRMNATTEKTFTMPPGVSALDGKKAIIMHQNDTAKLNVLAQGTNRIGFSATAPGSMYHNISGEAGANVTLEWCNTLNTWMPISGYGTWGVS